MVNQSAYEETRGGALNEETRGGAMISYKNERFIRFTQLRVLHLIVWINEGQEPADSDESGSERRTHSTRTETIEQLSMVAFRV